MANLINTLLTEFDFSEEQVRRGIAERVDGVEADLLDVRKWINDDNTMPHWARRAAAHWIIALWMRERDACAAADLLAVDKRFTRILGAFSMGEIIAMRNEVVDGLKKVSD
jgi:hypothetical protein